MEIFHSTFSDRYVVPQKPRVSGKMHEYKMGASEEARCSGGRRMVAFFRVVHPQQRPFVRCYVKKMALYECTSRPNCTQSPVYTLFGKNFVVQRISQPFTGFQTMTKVNLT